MKTDKKTDGEEVKKGRPTKYNKKLGNLICSRLMEGESLRSICRDDDIPPMGTVMRWLVINSGKTYDLFREQYAQARLINADIVFEDLLDISDEKTNDIVIKEGKDGKAYESVDHENIQRSKLKVDTRKWVLARMNSKKYSEKTYTDNTNREEKDPLSEYSEGMDD